MPVRKLKVFLDRNQVKYVSIAHSVAYTAQEIAALTHTKGREMAKTVIVFLDDRMAMAVVPASAQVDLLRLRKASGADGVRLATETEFKGRFPECETGAMPPFGNLWDMEVFVDEILAKDEHIAFNAGSHNELIRLAYQDFARLVNPYVVPLARQAKTVAA